VQVQPAFVLWMFPCQQLWLRDRTVVLPH